jgi:hypothetical protein
VRWYGPTWAGGLRPGRAPEPEAEHWERSHWKRFQEH